MCNFAFNGWWMLKDTVATLIPSSTQSCKQGTLKAFVEGDSRERQPPGEALSGLTAGPCTLTDAGTLQKEDHEATHVPHEPYAH